MGCGAYNLPWQLKFSGCCNSVDCTIHQKILDPLGRYIILKAETKDKIYVLTNIYAPNKDKDIVAFLTKLLITLQNEDLDSENNIVIGGD